MKRIVDIAWIIPVSLVTGLLLSLLDGHTWWIGMLSYSLLLLVGLWCIALLWRKAGGSRALLLILLLSLLLRLGLGIFFSFVLPEYGYDNGIHDQGYIFRDALNRDVQSWEIASTGEPLWKAFTKSYSADQYGGMLFLNASIYRFLSPDAQRPWLVIMLGALAAAIGVALSFLAARSAWNARTAWLAAALVAFYPEAILLGSQQMREPFLITFLVMLFLGLLQWQQDRRSSTAWMAGGMIGLLLFNPGVAIFSLVVLIPWLWFKRGGMISWRAGVLVLIVLAVGVLLLWFGLARGNLAGASLFEALAGWLGYSSSWDLYLTQRASDGLQPLFDALPKILHLPLVTAYGLFQPVLPGAIFDVAPWPVQALGILRGLGWYALLPFLAFSIFTPLGVSRQEKRAWFWLCLVTWAWILLASFRAGGDQWDNPRYRVILIFFQAVLAGWAWLQWRASRNPWMGRLLLIEGIFLAVFSYWYAGRYTDWPIPHFSFPVIIGIIIVLAFMVIAGGWGLDRCKKRGA